MWMPILLVGGCMGMILFLCFLLQSERVIYSNQSVKFFFFVVALALALFGTSAKPMADWDSYRHFLLLDEVRESGISFINFMFHNENSVGGEDYVDLYGFNLVRYISVLLGDNRWLVFILTLLTYCNWAYISCDFIERYSVRKNSLLIATLLCFTFLPFIYVPSGMRNAVATSIAALAIYRFYMKNNGLIDSLLLLVLSCTFHPSMVITLAVFMFSLINKKSLAVIALLLSVIGIESLTIIGNHTSIGFFKLIAEKYVIYKGENISGAFVGYWVADVVGVVLLLLYMLPIIIRNRNTLVFFDSRMSKFLWFLFLYVVTAITQFGSFNLLRRLCYLFAFFSMPVTYTCVFLGRKESYFVRSVIMLAFGAIGVLISVYLHAYSFIFTTYIW